ncbi:MAG TPA: glycosyltransferase family 4 protein [Anaerolineales bacterium]|nr:glycosyltransferase family 4 protein [Anaerolineales bacterium]
MESLSHRPMNTHQSTFPGRMAIQQRVLPVYRAPLMDTLAVNCGGGLSVFSGDPLPGEGITAAGDLQVAKRVFARNRHFSNPGSALYQCYQDGLVDWLESWQPDVLIVEANPRYPNTRQGIDWMHTHNRPVLGWGLGAPPIHGPLAAWRRVLRQRLLRSLDGVIAYSQRGAQEYLQAGIAADRIFVALNAAAHRPIQSPPEKPLHFSTQPVVLYVGRLQARKRLDLLIQACASLPAALQPHLLIVGDGPAGTDLKTLAGQIYPGTEFTGSLFGEALEACFQKADVFVLPGTGGLAVQQAMAWGLPVIVAEGDGTQDDLVRSENGWRIIPGSQGDLTSKLQAALSDPGRLRQMGLASYRIVDQEVNLETMAQVFIRAARQVTGMEHGADGC